MIKDIRILFNHPKLKPDTQTKLKFLYRANEEIEKKQQKEEVYNFRNAKSSEIGIIDTSNEDHRFTMELSPNVEPNKLYDVTMAHQDLSTSGEAFQVKSDDVDFSPPS